MAKSINKSRELRVGLYTITIHPTGAVEIRERGERRSFTTTLEAIYHMAIRRTLPEDIQRAVQPRNLPKRGSNC